MDGRRWAVIVGINQCGYNFDLPSLRYAERDARAVHDVIADRGIGTFEEEDVDLLVGENVTWKAVKRRLRDRVMSSEPSDVLLMYFAGHAFVPSWSRQSDAYLATADLDVDTIFNEPENGVRMSFLKRDIFDAFAGTSFLVLDCCNAGAYLESDLRRTDSVSTYGPQIDRHSALLSCPDGAAARETEAYEHGVLTYHLLRALRGEAADLDGRVSFAQMANFVAEQPIDPVPGQLVQIWGPTTVITQPSATRHKRKQPLTQSVSVAKVVNCENPLERCTSSINQLLARILRPGERIPRQRESSRDTRRPEIIRHALEAEALAVVEFSASGAKAFDVTARFNVHEMQPLLDQSSTYAFPAQTTMLGHVASDDSGRRILSVPLSHDKTRSLVLVVVDPALSLLEMGEPLAAMLQALWKLDFLEDPLQSEIQVLTALRTAFGRLPVSLYEHCFALYKDLVGSLAMVFQPVVSLDKRAHGVGIHSYEALARRVESDVRAPVELLKLAHAWGDRFILERDAVLLTKAVRSYAQADAVGPWDITKPISINVAVRSVLSDSYLAMVSSVLAEAHLDPRTVTLEVSERDPIEPAADEVWPEEPLKYFHRRLTQLARDLEISFAVDDFGVGYASLARMAELPLTQIKVDRAVLHHPLALDELDLVVRVARYASDLGHASSPRVVVVEGFDEESPVTLQQIFEKRIRYVQGFVTGEPALTSLRPLSEELRDRVAALVRGEDDKRQTTITARGN